MKKWMKNHKLFTILVFYSILLVLIGIIHYTLLDGSIKKDLFDKVILYRDSFTQEKNIFSIIGSALFKKTGSFVFYWLLGISFIGIPVFLFLYSFKIYLFSFEFIFLFTHIKQITFPFFLLYVVGESLLFLFFFFLFYYALIYSFLLFQYLFLKKEFPIKKVTHKYLKVGIFLLIGEIFSCLLQNIFLYIIYPMI